LTIGRPKKAKSNQESFTGGKGRRNEHLQGGGETTIGGNGFYQLSKTTKGPSPKRRKVGKDEIIQTNVVGVPTATEINSSTSGKVFPSYSRGKCRW